MTLLIPLEQWNRTKFGGRYSLKTLRLWAKSGYISPPAQKVGRDWLVDSDAIYLKSLTVNNIPIYEGMELSLVDPLVLSILNQ